MSAEYIIELLVAAGHVTREKVEQAREIANDVQAAPVAAAPVDGDFDGASYKRMFIDACEALAEVSRELDCDPAEGGAEPILAAIAKLKASIPAAPGIDLEQFRDCVTTTRAIALQTMSNALNRGAESAAADAKRDIDECDRLLAQIDASLKDGSDSARLDALEKLVDDSGRALLLHHGCDNGRGFNGLGLRNTGRTLRQAIDQATSAEVGA